jgi:hypothetical protein
MTQKNRPSVLCFGPQQSAGLLRPRGFDPHSKQPARCMRVAGVFVVEPRGIDLPRGSLGQLARSIPANSPLDCLRSRNVPVDS